MWIPGNLKKLGLDPKSLKYILVTHGHSDHVAGASYLQSLYASKVILTAEGYKLAVEQANQSEGDGKFSAPSVEAYAEDGGTLTVGDTTFRLYITPGIQKGAYPLILTLKTAPRKAV